MTKENNGWISVEDRLPDNGESVLVYTGALPRIAHYVGGVFFDAYAEFDGHIVTHWQTLPKPPQD